MMIALLVIVLLYSILTISLLTNANIEQRMVINQLIELNKKIKESNDKLDKLNVTVYELSEFYIDVNHDTLMRDDNTITLDNK